MRKSIVLALTVAAAACGTSQEPSDPSDREDEVQAGATDEDLLAEPREGEVEEPPTEEEEPPSQEEETPVEEGGVEHRLGEPFELRWTLTDIDNGEEMDHEMTIIVEGVNCTDSYDTGDAGIGVIESEAGQFCEVTYIIENTGSRPTAFHGADYLMSDAGNLYLESPYSYDVGLYRDALTGFPVNPGIEEEQVQAFDIPIDESPAAVQFDTAEDVVFVMLD